MHVMMGSSSNTGVDVLHVVERVEEGVDELCGLDEESGELILHGGVDVVVLSGRNLKVLFKLELFMTRM